MCVCVCARAPLLFHWSSPRAMSLSVAVVVEDAEKRDCMLGGAHELASCGESAPPPRLPSSNTHAAPVMPWLSRFCNSSFDHPNPHPAPAPFPPFLSLQKDGGCRPHPCARPNRQHRPPAHPPPATREARTTAHAPPHRPPAASRKRGAPPAFGVSAPGTATHPTSRAARVSAAPPSSLFLVFAVGWCLLSPPPCWPSAPRPHPAKHRTTRKPPPVCAYGGVIATMLADRGRRPHATHPTPFPAHMLMKMRARLRVIAGRFLSEPTPYWHTHPRPRRR